MHDSIQLQRKYENCSRFIHDRCSSHDSVHFCVIIGVHWSSVLGFPGAFSFLVLTLPSGDSLVAISLIGAQGAFRRGRPWHRHNNIFPLPCWHRDFLFQRRTSPYEVDTHESLFAGAADETFQLLFWVDLRLSCGEVLARKHNSILGISVRRTVAASSWDFYALRSFCLGSDETWWDWFEMERNVTLAKM